MLDDKLIEWLEYKAAPPCGKDLGDKFNPGTYYGKDVETVYLCGIADGEIQLAREILEVIKPKNK